MILTTLPEGSFAVLGAGLTGAMAYAFSVTFVLGCRRRGIRHLATLHRGVLLGHAEMGGLADEPHAGQVDNPHCLLMGSR